MKQRALVSEGTILRLMQVAQDAFLNGKFEECFGAFERARRMAPANPQILLQIGDCYLRRYENTRAVEYFERAIKLSPNKTATLEDAGTRCRVASAFGLAREYLEKAAARKDVSAEGLATLAWVYERLRHTGEANGAAERALKLKPNSPAAILIKARLEQLGGKSAEAEARLRAFTTSRDEVPARVRAAYELGAILDRQGRYDEAMAAFREAKALLKPLSARNAVELKDIQGRFHALVDSLTPGILQRWKDSLTAYQPHLRIALLGGHPRSGTTLLEQVLDSHPEIISAEETDIFINDAYYPLRAQHPYSTPMLEVLESADAERISKSRKNYLRQMETFLGQPLGNRLLVDKNPTMTSLVPLLARIFPEIKFLVALRDPRDVCISCFMQPAPLNQDSSAWLSLETTVDSYISFMGRWRRTAQILPNPHLEVRYEDMVTDLELVARKALEFLGAGWDPKVLGFDEHARQKTVRSPTYSDVTKKVFKTAVGRWRNYQKYFEPHLAKLEPLAKELGYE